LATLCDNNEHSGMLLDAAPANELVKLGELHMTNPKIIDPVLRLLATEAFDSIKVREELIRSSAVAVPLRALDFAWADAKISVLALIALKRLTFRSRDALRQCHRANGINVVWKLLQLHQKDPIVVREALSTIAYIAKHPKARLQLINLWQVETLDVLDQILHIVSLTVGEDGDILAQGVLALGTLTANQDPVVEQHLRKQIDKNLLNEAIWRAAAELPIIEFVGTRNAPAICEYLLEIALPSELYHDRVFTKGGRLIADLPELHKLADMPDPLEPPARRQRAKDAAEQVGAEDKFDIFAPLRGLGVGNQEQWGEEPNDGDEDDEYEPQPDPDGGILKMVGLGRGDDDNPGFFHGGELGDLPGINLLPDIPGFG